VVLVGMGMMPWHQAGVARSPFVGVLDFVGVPHAPGVMNFVCASRLRFQAPTAACMSHRALCSLSLAEAMLRLHWES